MAAATTSFSATTVTGLDFQTLMESHAYISYLKSEKWSNCEIRDFLLNGTSSEFESLRFDVHWEKAKLEFQDPDWKFPENDVRDSSRNVNEVWENKNKYTNKAVFSLTWHEGNTSGLGLNTSLKLPDQAKDVFGESTFLDINGPSFETHHDQELNIDVNVPIPLNQTIKLFTVLHEKTFTGTFSSRAYLRGRVSVQIFKKKNNELLVTVTDDVCDFWRKMKREISSYEVKPENANSIVNRLSPFEAIPEEHRDMVWKISGKCCFTVGTHGSVKVESAE